MNKTEYLLELCHKPESNIAEIEQYLNESGFNPEETTHLLFRFLEEYAYHFECPRPLPDDLIEPKLIEVFKVFSKYGLQPNLIINELNIMQVIRHIYYGNTAPVLVRMLLEHGLDPNLEVDGETIFEELDFDIVFDVVELENKALFNIEFKVWLVMMGYGGTIQGGRCPVELKNGYEIEMFKRFENFDYEIEFLKKDWIMHIFNKESGEEVAIL